MAWQRTSAARLPFVVRSIVDRISGDKLLDGTQIPGDISTREVRHGGRVLVNASGQWLGPRCDAPGDPGEDAAGDFGRFPVVGVSQALAGTWRTGQVLFIREYARPVIHRDNTFRLVGLELVCEARVDSQVIRVTTNAEPGSTVHWDNNGVKGSGPVADGVPFVADTRFEIYVQDRLRNRSQVVVLRT
jgi:hypothetical protein